MMELESMLFDYTRVDSSFIYTCMIVLKLVLVLALVLAMAQYVDVML